jgi:hypothetical protein
MAWEVPFQDRAVQKQHAMKRVCGGANIYVLSQDARKEEEEIRDPQFPPKAHPNDLRTSQKVSPPKGPQNLPVAPPRDIQHP